MDFVQNNIDKSLRNKSPSFPTIITTSQFLPPILVAWLITTDFSWYNSSKLSSFISNCLAGGDCNKYRKNTPPNCIHATGDTTWSSIFTILCGPRMKLSINAGCSDWLWTTIKSSKRERVDELNDSISFRLSRNALHTVIISLRINLSSVKDMIGYEQDCNFCNWDDNEFDNDNDNGYLHRVLLQEIH